TNFAAFVNLLVSIDRPLRSIDDPFDDVLLGMMGQFIDLYRIWLVKVDIPSEFSEEDEINYQDQNYGPDSETALLANQIIQLLYTTHSLLLSTPKNEPLRLAQNIDQTIAELRREIIGTPPIPEGIDTSDPQFLVNLKARDRDQFQATTEAIHNVYLYYKNNQERPKPLLAQTGIAAEVYVVEWKNLKSPFESEVSQLLPADGSSEEDQAKMLETVITFRKLIPWLQRTQANIDKQVRFLFKRQTWMEEKTLFEFIVKIDEPDQSIARQLLKMVDGIDRETLRRNSKLALSEFVVPLFNEDLAPFEKLFRTAKNEEFLTYFGTFIKEMQYLDPEFTDSLLFLMVSLLESHQGLHDYLIRDVEYTEEEETVNPWSNWPTEKRIDSLLSFAIPMVEVASHPAIRDAAIDFLYFLRPARFYVNSSFQDYESKEFTNFWAEELLELSKYLPDAILLSQGTAENIELTIENITKDNEFFILLDETVLPALDRVYKDEEVSTALELQDGLPLEIGLLFETLKHKGALADIASICEDREQLDPALHFIDKNLREEEGLYRTLRIFNRLTSPASGRN
ncbi:hypothetical protein ACFLRA_01360, partial [Bdellovibrionota bacterium]